MTWSNNTARVCCHGRHHMLVLSMLSIESGPGCLKKRGARAMVGQGHVIMTWSKLNDVSSASSSSLHCQVGEVRARADQHQCHLISWMSMSLIIRGEEEVWGRHHDDKGKDNGFVVMSCLGCHIVMLSKSS